MPAHVHGRLYTARTNPLRKAPVPYNSPPDSLLSMHKSPSPFLPAPTPARTRTPTPSPYQTHPTQQVHVNYIPLKKLSCLIPTLRSLLIALTTCCLFSRLSVAEASGPVRSIDCFWIGTGGVAWAARAAALRSWRRRC